MFCHQCGNQLSDDSKFCDKCGAKLVENIPAPPAKRVTVSQALEKADEEVVWSSSLSSNTAALLSLFFGSLGLHDFYCGNTGHGVLKLLFTFTVVLSFISIGWNLMDLYSIGEGSYTDSEGLYLEPNGWPKVVVVLLILPSMALAALLLFVVLPFIIHAVGF